MRRRELVVGMSGLAAALRFPTAAAQPAVKISRVGYLSPASSESPGYAILRQSLRDLGYVEGQTIAFQEGFADGDPARLPVLAADLVRQNVDVIVAPSPPAMRAAHSATRTIPIVMLAGDDPIRGGFVTSLARPGGNITGVTFQFAELFAKQMELLKEMIPGLTRVAFLLDPAMPTARDLTDVRGAARVLRLQVQFVDARGGGDYEGAFAAMAAARAEALLIAPSPTFLQDRSRIVSLAMKHRLPTIYSLREDVVAGGLASYGPRYADTIRLVASYVDRILKGAKPADLPVVQPTTFELVLNLNTAKALELTIAPSLLARADEVIE